MSALTSDTREDLDAMADGLGVLCIMDSTGDTRIMFDPNVPDEVATARAAFDAAIGRGMRAYSVTEGGGQGDLIKEFPATAGKVIMAPALVGG